MYLFGISFLSFHLWSSISTHPHLFRFLSTLQQTHKSNTLQRISCESFLLTSSHFARKGTKYVSLADYCAMGNSEVSMKEGATVELKKIGCAGWWFVRVLGKCFILFLSSRHISLEFHPKLHLLIY